MGCMRGPVVESRASLLRGGPDAGAANALRAARRQTPAPRRPAGLRVVTSVRSRSGGFPSAESGLTSARFPSPDSQNKDAGGSLNTEPIHAARLMLLYHSAGPTGHQVVSAMRSAGMLGPRRPPQCALSSAGDPRARLRPVCVRGGDPFGTNNCTTGRRDAFGHAARCSVLKVGRSPW
jgi:hypothetical protein